MNMNAVVDVRKVNRNRIYRYVYDTSEPVTKQDIANSLKLSLPTVTLYLDELMKEGLLSYGDTVASTGGRKPRAIMLCADARMAIGISIGDVAIRIVAIDLKVNELAYQKVQRTFEDTDAYYAALSRLVEKFIADHAFSREQILGIGITLPGIVKEESDLVEYAPRLKLRKKKVSDIKKFFPYVSYLVNDANARGFAEWWNHPQQGNMAYLSVDRGVGGTILMNNASYFGDHGRSAEFGHMCIVSDGRLCSCGQNGCLEAYCSVSRISDDLDVTLEEFFSMLDAGNQQISIVWDVYLNHLARGIVSIRAVLDCEIVLSGLLAPFMDGHMHELCDIVAKLSPFDTNGLFVRLCHFRSRSSGVGAALHFIGEFMETIK